jgi:hypothetical protein
LRLDEEYVERRKQNVQNYGNSWIKPPGIPKSLYQIREEKREMEEHQEALRREQLAQELAEAEAEAAETMLQLEDAGAGEMEEVRDLDDDVPDAEVTVLDEDSSDSGDEENDAEVEEVPRGVMASRIPDDVYREALVRGEEVRPRRGSTIDDEDQSQMLQEEDLVHENRPGHEIDMDIDADLDAEIPEAEEGGYEHTDSELELSSSDEESIEDERLPQHHPASTSMVRSDGTQNSMDIGSMVSNASSQMGSSPRQRQSWRGRRRGS